MAELGVVRRRYVFPVNRAIIFSAVVGALPLFAAGCSSTPQTRDYYRRKHTYQASLSRITFPTTRARFYAELPPASSIRMSSLGSPIMASERYALDADFGISMSVFYAQFAQPLTRGTRGEGNIPIRPAKIDELLFRPQTIHRSPKDTILAASLTK